MGAPLSNLATQLLKQLKRLRIDKVCSPLAILTNLVRAYLWQSFPIQLEDLLGWQGLPKIISRDFLSQPLSNLATNPPKQVKWLRIDKVCSPLAILAKLVRAYLWQSFPIQLEDFLDWQGLPKLFSRNFLSPPLSNLATNPLYPFQWLRIDKVCSPLAILAKVILAKLSFPTFVKPCNESA